MNSNAARVDGIYSLRADSTRCDWHFCDMSSRRDVVVIGGNVDVARTSSFLGRLPSMETLPIRPALLVAQEVQDGEIELPRVLQKGEMACVWQDQQARVRDRRPRYIRCAHA